MPMETAQFEEKDAPESAVAIEQQLESLDVEALRAELHYPFNTEDVPRAFARLALDLKDKLPSYETIISDDASGRLVARFFYRLINNARKAEDKKAAPAYFVIGGRKNPGYQESKQDERERKAENAEIDAAIERFIRDKKGAALGKTLLVTEYIKEGNSIVNLMKLLEQNGVDLDVAALSLEHEPDAYRKSLIKKLHYGEVGLSTPSLFYRDQGRSGVQRGRNDEDAPVTNFAGEPFKNSSVVRRGIQKAFPGKAGYQNPDLVKLARKDADLLADRLYEWLNPKSAS